MVTRTKFVGKKLSADVLREEHELLLQIDLLGRLEQMLSSVILAEGKVEGLSSAMVDGDGESVGNHVSEIDKHFSEIKSLVRRIGREERRSERYSERVLKDIKELKGHVESKDMTKILNFSLKIQVYTNTLVKELSFYGGELSGKLSAKDAAGAREVEGQAHAAAMGLLVLIRELKAEIAKIKKEFESHDRFRSEHAIVLRLSGKLRECAIKTVHVKSVPAMKYFLERRLDTSKMNYKHGRYSKNSTFSWEGASALARMWVKLLLGYKKYFLKVLTPKDFEQLCRLQFRVPTDSVILFGPKFKSAKVVLNVQAAPSFVYPGWASHFFPKENLAYILKDAGFSSPLDTLNKKGKYFSSKNHDVIRLRDGISVGFQDYKEWSAYALSTVREKRAWKPKGKFSGMILFSMDSLLKYGKRVDFADTKDQFPEACIRDMRVGEEATAQFIFELLSVRTMYGLWMEKYDFVKKAFLAAKIYADELYSKVEVLGKRVSLNVRVVDGSCEFSYYDSEKSKHIVIERGNNEYYHSLTVDRHVPSNGRISVNLETVKYCAKYAKENNFFQFSLAHQFQSNRISFHDKHLIPSVSRPISRFHSKILGGTSFVSGFDLIGVPVGNSRSSVQTSYVVAAYMKKHPLLWRGVGYRRKTLNAIDYLDLMKNMSPAKVKAVFLHAISQTLLDIRQIIKNTLPKGSKPIKLPLNSGVLIPHLFSSRKEDIDFLRKSLACVVLGMRFDHNKAFDSEEMDFLIHSVFGAQDIPGLSSKNKNDKCYIEEERGVVYLFNRSSGSKRRVA